jgi:Polysulphide reductase, NrfD
VSAPRPDGGPRSDAGGDGATRSYYGRPIVKVPPWSDEIPWYLFTGGLAGGSATLGMAARLAGNQRLAANAMTISAAGVAASLLLLVDDLGRPARFHHMLRVLKPTSPMSVGSWLLAGLGPAAVGAAVAERLGIFPRLRRVAEVAAGALGPAMATYTGVLIADTAVPTWHGAGRELPLLFAASAAASSGGLAAIVTPPADAGPARRLAVGGALVEVATTEVMLRRLGPLAEPFRQGSARRLSSLARVAAGAGALLLCLGGRRRATAAAGGALLVASSACQRFAIYRAGIASASDPSYTVRQQRERIAETGQERAIRR